MKFLKPLAYVNIGALVVNGILVWLMVVRLFPPILGIFIFLGLLASLVWFSCYVNGKLPKRAPKYTFYSAPTERMERL